MLEILGLGFLFLLAAIVFLLVWPGSPVRHAVGNLFKGGLAGLAGLIYALSPLDLIPDIFPVVGQVDDFAIILMLLYYWYTLYSGDAKKEGPEKGPRGPKTGPGGPIIDIKPEA